MTSPAYRDLSPGELELINLVRAKAEEVGELVKKIQSTPGIDVRWWSIAQTDLQKGFMELKRSIAQPPEF